MNPYDLIKEEIILGKLKPGSIFNEKEYAEKLSLSRTPIREAVLKLNDEGYIHIIPRKGTIIASLSLDEVISLYEYRMIIEPNIYSYIKQEVQSSWIDKWISYFIEKDKIKQNQKENILKDDDKDFHVELVSFTNNEILIQNEKKVMDKCLRARILSNIESDERFKSSLKEHIQILEALKKKDFEKCSSLSLQHLKNTIQGFTFIGK